MYHSKEYYQAILHVIDYVNEFLPDSITLEKGVDLAGDYWPAVIKAFQNADVIRTSSGGSIWLRDLQNLAPLAAECEAKIKAIEASEKHFKLSIEQMENQIVYGRKGYRLSKVAIWISVGSFIGNVLLSILLRLL